MNDTDMMIGNHSPILNHKQHIEHQQQPQKQQLNEQLHAAAAQPQPQSQPQAQPQLQAQPQPQPQAQTQSKTQTQVEPTQKQVEPKKKVRNDVFGIDPDAYYALITLYNRDGTITTKNKIRMLDTRLTFGSDKSCNLSLDRAGVEPLHVMIQYDINIRQFVLTPMCSITRCDTIRVNFVPGIYRPIILHNNDIVTISFRSFKITFNRDVGGVPIPESFFSSSFMPHNMMAMPGTAAATTVTPAAAAKDPLIATTTKRAIVIKKPAPKPVTGVILSSEDLSSIIGERGVGAKGGNRKNETQQSHVVPKSTQNHDDDESESSEEDDFEPKARTHISLSASIKKPAPAVAQPKAATTALPSKPQATKQQQKKQPPVQVQEEVEEDDEEMDEEDEDEEVEVEAKTQPRTKQQSKAVKPQTIMMEVTPKKDRNMPSSSKRVAKVAPRFLEEVIQNLTPKKNAPAAKPVKTAKPAPTRVAATKSEPAPVAKPFTKRKKSVAEPAIVTAPVKSKKPATTTTTTKPATAVATVNKSLTKNQIKAMMAPVKVPTTSTNAMVAAVTKLSTGVDARLPAVIDKSSLNNFQRKIISVMEKLDLQTYILDDTEVKTTMPFLYLPALGQFPKGISDMVDYYQMIESPISLGMIKNRLLAGCYEDDIELICEQMELIAKNVQEFLGYDTDYCRDICDTLVLFLKGVREARLLNPAECKAKLERVGLIRQGYNPDDPDDSEEEKEEKEEKEEEEEEEEGAEDDVEAEDDEEDQEAEEAEDEDEEEEELDDVQVDEEEDDDEEDQAVVPTKPKTVTKQAKPTSKVQAAESSDEEEEVADDVEEEQDEEQDDVEEQDDDAEEEDVDVQGEADEDEEEEACDSNDSL
ncbi:hypothetical protein SAMD00019534_084930 [Acytostelium subglobosum LB1]|uniref:hypothetical protein n=1 Tax=Acytostelium subglobosum LB1 TaxID=1410327 RepID=UPI000644FB6F|nr:hypothetical protein SAMD00019534_084930 [Acytostelium subglobosum LB1]GAM25318.1 hypothetical protein SAMD00019534_084930 [Acytostelium subglobosum LB1]|eukprot:XP_012751838.1 hypothetical protein SAMD00019534_084930 [Acytostelium subglobosum LB1]